MTKPIIIASWTSSCAGLEFIGKPFKGAVYPKTYATRALAVQAALDAGDGWAPFRPDWSRSWYVARDAG